MNAHVIERQFAKIGARAQVHADPVRFGGTVSIDIGRDGAGEFFDIGVGRTRDLDVVDARPRIRHLLLMSRQSDGNHKFLCGHDERHWFVAAVPERASVSNVQTAFEALKPAAVQNRVEQLRADVNQNGLTEAQYRKLISRKPKLRKLGWVTQRRNPGVFVRGKVRHSDHKTIVLDGWHRVLMNTETESVAMRHVAFID